MEKNNINMKRHTFDEVTYLDDALHQLAMYEVSGGRILVPKTLEDIAELHTKVAHKFNEFKTLIQNGDCTYEFIKWTVLDKNGPFIQKNKGGFNINDINVWDKIEKEWQEEDAAKNKNVKYFMDAFLDGFKSKDKDGNEITIEPLDNLNNKEKLDMLDLDAINEEDLDILNEDVFKIRKPPKNNIETDPKEIKDKPKIPPKISIKDEVEKRKKRKNDKDKDSKK